MTGSKRPAQPLRHALRRAEGRHCSTAALSAVPEPTPDPVYDLATRRREAPQPDDLAGRLVDAQETERRRIGRELHDHFGPALTILVLRIDRLRADPAIGRDMERGLDELRRRADEIADEVHRLSHRFHSSPLDHEGLAPAIARLVTEFSSHHGLAIELSPTSMPYELPADVALCLFRVTEESLTNIARHSEARSVRVALSGNAQGIRLTVEDDGEGFDPVVAARRPGLGFVSMRERLRALHGVVRIDSAPSRGTRVDAWVPWPAAPAGESPPRIVSPASTAA